ncbi:MAG: helix-turn-helix domain-containing protein [Spirosomataceae bacterium]
MHISILAIEEQSNLSTVACMAGAYEIFTEANSFWSAKSKRVKFKIELVSATENSNPSNNLFALKSHKSINQIEKTDLIIVPASLVRSYDTASQNNKLFIKWIEEQYKKGAEIASMCTGVFMLASTGLLEQKTCSTHWSVSEQFKVQFPTIDLQTDKLITDESGIYTNGGAYSFLHLIIYLVEKYFDRETAVYCAKIFQIDLDRNLQAEFLIFNGHKKHNDEVVLQSQNYFETNYSNKISIEVLSEKYNVGRRNFDRRFVKATGLSPLDYLQRVRIEVAKKLFENSRKTVNEVMYDVGYNDTKAFREVFSRVCGLSPIEYKSKYNKERKLSVV